MFEGNGNIRPCKASTHYTCVLHSSWVPKSKSISIQQNSTETRHFSHTNYCTDHTQYVVSILKWYGVCPSIYLYHRLIASKHQQRAVSLLQSGAGEISVDSWQVALQLSTDLAAVQPLCCCHACHRLRITCWPRKFLYDCKVRYAAYLFDVHHTSFYKVCSLVFEI